MVPGADAVPHREVPAVTVALIRASLVPAAAALVYGAVWLAMRWGK